jgi:sialidase-1
MHSSLSVVSRATLFRAETLGYHTYRIPAVVNLGDGTIVVAAEGRRDSVQDWGEIDLVVRRSTDGGRTFDEQRTLITDPGYTCGNPTWLFDERGGELALLFCKNLADQPEALVLEGKAMRSVWLCLSRDGGLSFSSPREITSQVKPANWTWYATGPGRGLALRNGRWVVPCCHAVNVTTTHDDPVRSHLIVSDDCGATWRVAGSLHVARSSECGLAEVRPNVVYVDFRNDAAPHARGGALSIDAGDSFSWHTLHENVTDPGCRGGVTGGARDGEVWLSHARGPKRRDLVLEYSNDDGRCFTQVLEVALGCAAYSDLVCLGQRQLACAFETGENSAYERIDWCRIG